MFKNKVYSIFIYINVMLLVYIFILSVFIQSPSLLNYPSFLVLAALLFILVFAFAVYRLLSRVKISNTIFLLILVLVTITPRLLWILLVKTQPYSDFILFNNYAINASKGVFGLYDQSYMVFPFKFGYPLVLSVIYRIFGPYIISAKLFNIFISICISLQIYNISGRIFNNRIGRITSVLYSLWPAQIMFNSVLASEHIFLMFLLFSIQLFLKTISNIDTRKSFIFSIGTGISLALTQFIRPVALILIPVFAVYLLLFMQSHDSIHNFIIFKLKTAFTIGMIFIISFFALTLPLSKLIGLPIYKSSSGFNLLIGTNFVSNGTYNNEDAKIISEYDYDYSAIHKEATHRAVNRILSQPEIFTMLMEKKYLTQWGSEDYGIYWSILNTERTNAIGEYLINSPRKLKAATQLYYIFILLMSITGSYFCLKRRKYQIVIFTLLFQGLFLAHTVLEVQSRYHFPAMPALIILAGFGVYCVNESIDSISPQ